MNEPNNLIKVAIIDDDIRWSNQLIQFLIGQGNFVVSWSSTSKEEAVKFAKVNAVDIILMDLNLEAGEKENYDGIFATIEVLESDIKAKVVILTNLIDDELVINSIIAGAVDYIYKENFKDLPKVLNSIIKNEYNPLKIISQEYARVRKNETLRILTPTELEVLSLLEQRFTQSQIAEKFCITPDCVKKHVSHILKKLEAKDTSEALKNIKLKSLYWNRKKTND
jgi:NarL family two-component system response regulator LiaR